MSSEKPYNQRNLLTMPDGTTITPTGKFDVSNPGNRTYIHKSDDSVRMKAERQGQGQGPVKGGRKYGTKKRRNKKSKKSKKSKKRRNKKSKRNTRKK